MKKIIFFVRSHAFFSFFIFIIICIGTLWKISTSQKHHIEYQVIEIKKGVLNINILATGTVAPNNRVDLKPAVSGRIEKIMVDEGQKVKKGQVLAWMSSTERAALVDAARAQGDDELKKWEQSYQMTPILSPVNGLIILKNLVEGQTVTTSDSILSMSDSLMIKASVDETDLSQIWLNQKCRVTLDAYPDMAIESLVKKISYDAKTVNSVTTYEVDVLPKKTPPFMRSGMTANVEFLIKKRDSVLILPLSSLEKKEDSVFVYVPDEKGKPIERKIKIGNSDGKNVEILSGLMEGDKILVPNITSLNGIKKDVEESQTFGRPKPSSKKKSS